MSKLRDEIREAGAAEARRITQPPPQVDPKRPLPPGPIRDGVVGAYADALSYAAGLHDGHDLAPWQRNAHTLERLLREILQRSCPAIGIGAASRDFDPVAYCLGSDDYRARALLVGTLSAYADQRRLQSAQYLRASETSTAWCGASVVPDFRENVASTSLGVRPLSDVGPAGEIENVPATVHQQPTQATEPAGRITITRRALTNGDMGPINSQIDALIAAAYARRDQNAYGLLNDNPTQADGLAIFDENTRGNTRGHGVGGVDAAALQDALAAYSAIALPSGAKQPLPRYHIHSTSEAATVRPLYPDNTPTLTGINEVPRQVLDASPVVVIFAEAMPSGTFVLAGDRALNPGIVHFTLPGESEPRINQGERADISGLSLTATWGLATTVINPFSLFKSTPT